jgi:hypothetical protein
LLASLTMPARGFVTATVLVVALVACGTAPCAFGDTLQLTIQPVQVCDDAGAACGNPAQTLFGAVTRAIWLQADIWFSALPWQTVFSTPLLDATFDEIVARSTPGVLSVWFVDEILDCGGVVEAYGCAAIGGSGVAIANSVFDDRRSDVLAHELGHVLGLGHVLDPFNLMAFGDLRLVPFGARDVHPVGSLSRLDAEQVALARGDPRLTPVPEPASIGLILAGAAVWAVRRRVASRSKTRVDGRG